MNAPEYSKEESPQQPGISAPGVPTCARALCYPRGTFVAFGGVLNRRGFLKKGVKVGAGAALGVLGVNALSPMLLPERPVFDTNRSLWMRFQPPHNPPLTKDLEVDVAVIGGGYTGLSSAFHIAQGAPGKKVVVLEARGVGNGASGRNGGMLLANTADAYLHLPSAPQRHKRVYDLTVESMRRLIALARASGVEGVVDPAGALKTLDTREECDRARAYVEKLRALGIPVEFWGREKTAAAIGSTAYEGALFDPNAGSVHPMKLVQVLKRAAEAAGATIYEDSPVEGLEEGPLHRLRLAAGPTVKARSLVLATNAYSSKLGWFRNATVPVYNWVAATFPLSDAQLAALGGQSRAPFHDSRKLVHYLHLTRDNRIVIGGGSAAYAFNNGVGERSDPGATDRLRQGLSRLFPKLQGVKMDVAWCGVVDITLDWAPLVGVAGKHRNVYYGLGYCGHGVNLSFLFGRILADLEGGRARNWSGLPFLNRQAPYLPNEPFRWLGLDAEITLARLART